MKSHIYIASLLLASLSTAAFAEETTDESPKFSVTPTGRILIDGALFSSPQKEMFKDGVAIPDARIGAKFQYGKWKAKVDLGFAYNKVGIKDLFIEYDFNEKNLIRVGSFIHQYGLQSATSSSMKPTMEEPVSNSIFNDPRQLGVMYVHSDDKFFATASAHVEPSATTYILTPDQFSQEGVGARTRLVARPICEEGKVVQLGISAGFATPQRHGNPDTHDAFTLKANFPTRVVQQTALEATVTKANNIWKFTPELLLNYGPVALESQYYWVRVNRKEDLYHFTGQGAYATVRGLILGGNYQYSPMDAGLATPRPHSLEAVASYNYTDVTCAKAGIFGGRMNDLSLTFNYYINKYIICRLHYSYTHTWGRKADGVDVPSVSLNGFMARLQVIF
ncbi:MAG: OprO/OprP family phosphate-selective porin [Muribaculaceae bacterium]|nr:OprO/OprP family phosphate-selective porin [Muribaculaceae bacterium]